MQFPLIIGKVGTEEQTRYYLPLAVKASQWSAAGIHLAENMTESAQ
jgi:hypothetical protein